MQKKKKKSKEQLTAESFFPLEPTNIKQTVEKLISPPPAKENLLKNTIEKDYKPRKNLPEGFDKDKHVLNIRVKNAEEAELYELAAKEIDNREIMIRILY